MKTRPIPDDTYLYLHMPQIEDIVIKSKESDWHKEHIFSEEFNQSIAKLMSSGSPRKKLMPKAAALVLTAFLAICGTGAAVNAASNGGLIQFIKEICFGKVNGSESVFFYGTSDSPEELDLSDFPEGTKEAEIIYQGEGRYTLKNGKEISINRIIFLNPPDKLRKGDLLSVFILPK